MQACVELKVFDGGGGWEVLIGKPLLRALKAVHDYEQDTVTVASTEDPGRRVMLKNVQGTETGQCPTVNMINDSPQIFTRNTEPFKLEHVAEILRLVQISPDISDSQREQTLELIAEFADCFALAISEVNAVPGYEHKLNVPVDAKLPIKPPPKSHNPAQKAYLEKSLDEMIAAGIVHPIKPSEVRCTALTVLAQKDHEGGGLTFNELKHKLNDECMAYGMESMPNMPPRPPPTDLENQTLKPPKWRICQNFDALNKVTKIVPVLQGDLRAKQLRLSGHRYVHVFDFAAGFYHLAINEESQPYLCFFVEGRGFYAYQRMPFGITGTPADFGNMMAAKTHDLTAKGMFKLFVDDGGSPADDFEEGMSKLRIILERVRQEKLSLSPSKLKLFMTEAVFAGAVVGPKGVSPDPKKLSTIVDWPIPGDASHLEGFLGLTSYFRDLVQGYAHVEAPLRNILRSVDVPAGAKKSTYQRIMKAYKLKDVWTKEHTQAFLRLKQLLVSEPVLVAPWFDGTPFILTTDGCIDAFAGVLCQKIATTMPSGKVVVKRHPIAFASKRTSVSERKYKPYLLEFAALKFAFDKFTDILYGFPVEVETDCQALRDVLLSEKLSATHARWRDGVLAHRITDVRHVPGVTNIADGLSRQYEGLPHTPGDGSDWTVNPDWEAKEGIINDMFHVSLRETQQADLRHCLRDEPLYIQVIDALEDLDHAQALPDRMRARHRASQYMIKDGKLWFIAGGTKIRARA